ncbi:MAG: bifunctional DNA-formamidopyrimidine glycosylase/DNA-(apurinic or apyrimidinic site) lyase [Paracoccaceae bacterium]
MPELPEVETVRRGLAPLLEGRRIERAEVRRPDLRWPLPPDLAAVLTGARVERLRRRSKYILADLDCGLTVILHLGMSGRILISGTVVGGFALPQAADDKHDHVILHAEGGARIAFNDTRRFGMIDLVPTETAEAHWLLEGIGPEPLGNAFDEAYLTQALATRAAPVKAALLDQRLVAGLGNIYVSEVLHRAGIHPARPARRIAAPRTARLVPLIREVLSEAIEAGGSTLRDYRQADGELGYFQHAFRVYGREGEPCRRDGCGGTVRRIVQSGRSSYYCPRCQH